MNKKKILIVLTNTPTYGQHNDATGLWLGEATEFVDEVTKRGFQVDYTSPKGGYVPIDPRSLRYADEATFAYYRDPQFQQLALIDSQPANQVVAQDYGAIYYTGGHGVMWDFPHNPYLQRLSESIYQQGGYLTSVCHGIAGLFYLQDQTGQPLIAGKKITGFTSAEEYLSGKAREIPFWNERVARQQGADFKQGFPYRPFALQDGQFITGQNPFSPRQVAQILMQNLI